jgi:signal transduction histidine kinase
MKPSHEHRPSRSRFPLNGYLWLLAGAMGLATLHATATTVHDTTQRRIAARLVTRAVAEQVAFAASHQLETAAVPTLAPALGLAAPRLESPRDVARALAAEHQAAERCGCRPTLPVTGFVYADFIVDSVVEVTATGATPSTTPARRTALASLARSELTAVDRGHAPVHFRVDSALQEVAIMALRRDPTGAPLGVVGILADRRALMDWLFSGATRGSPSLEPDSTQPLGTLDSLSLEVRTASGVSLFGRPAESWQFQATVQPPGALGDLRIAIALAPSQIAAPLIAPIAMGRLWQLGALILMTVVAIAFAVRASRREALLATARSDFVAGVSHELRMPLAQILLASETLSMQRERGEAERLTLANSIVREARRLIAMVENVLLFSRTGATTLRPRLEPVRVDELLTDVVEAVQLAADDAGQTIEIDSPPSLLVVGDRSLLRQALVNLVDNAMKYGRRGQTVRIIAEPGSADRVRLIVDDDGRGVPHAERARVFEPYERLARDQRSERTGTGLGLAVVREIVRACGGQVRIEASPSGGTRAVIDLDAASAPTAPTAASVSL